MARGLLFNQRMNMQTNEILSQIRSLYTKAAGLYYGEEITQLEHAMQCYDLAVEADADSATRVAAFLHDIGHLTDPAHTGAFGLPTHDDEGADLLEKWGFPAAVVQPVRLHVMAKRYLVAMNPEYLWSLSEASVQTLNAQGGPYTEEQCRVFQEMPFHEEAIRLRLWDDHGKAVFDMRTEVPEAVYAEIQSVLDEALALK